MSWDKVEGALPYAKAITWDGCHKIYLMMDDEQVRKMRGYGYDENEDDFLLVTDLMVAGLALRKWFDSSCPLRFITAVSTNHDDPNEGFIDLIAQGEEA